MKLFGRGSIVLAILTVPFFLVCDLGDQPLAPSVEPSDVTDSLPIPLDSVADSITQNMWIYSSPSVLSAGNKDSATVYVKVVESATNNPLADQVIYFYATTGLITAIDTTNSLGMAFAVLQSKPVNTEAGVYAWTTIDDSVVAVRTSVTFTGITIDVSATQSDVLVGTMVPVMITVTDGDGEPVSDEAVSITMDGVSSIDSTLGNGTALTSVTSSTQDSVKVVVRALGAADSTIVAFWQGSIPGDVIVDDTVTGQMEIYVSPSEIGASNTHQATVTVRVRDDNHNPLEGRTVTFGASHGTVSPTAVTGDDGTATAAFRSVPVNANAEIIATLTTSDTTLTATTIVTLSGLTIDVRPQRLNTVLGDIVPVTVAVNDASGEPVAAKQITLSGALDASGTTDGTGTFATSLTRSTQGDRTIIATGLGATDTAVVKFWTNLSEANIDTVTTIRNLRLYTSRAQLKANNSDSAIVTAILINAFNNPAEGESVTFSATIGVIDSVGTVDASGRARVVLRSAPINGICEIRAFAPESGDSASTRVTFSGVTLSLMPSATELKINEYADVEALLKDASGNPIPGENVTYTVTGGTFENGQQAFTTALDPEGRAVARVTASSSGWATILATALNTSDSVGVHFTTNRLSVVSDDASITVGGNDSTRISATYVNAAGSPLSGRTITFSTNAGAIRTASVATNANGIARTYLLSADFAGVATVHASAPEGDAECEVIFAAGATADIALTISPDNISINGGVSVLTATVRDANGNMVSDVDVNFRILKGPGGEEHITPGVVTSQDGLARSQIFAGSIPSQYRAVEVVAEAGSVADTSKLTISGEPHTITVSRPEDDTVVVKEAGIRDESTFEYYVGAVVKDVNGNPVADGTPVQFSSAVSGMAVYTRQFVRWSGVEDADDEIKPIIEYRFIDVEFEDVNDNKNMDPGIDLDLDDTPGEATRGDDVDGDGVMDYDIRNHDLFWWFGGAEPYWPTSKFYVTISDPNDPNYLPPDTTVTRRTEMVVTDSITPDSSTVVSDTTYRFVWDTTVVLPAIDSSYSIYADLNDNGRWDWTPAEVDHNGDGNYDGPNSGDFEWWRWEMLPYWKGRKFDFSTNEFAVVVDASVTTQDGVAYARLTYPRQLARRLFVSVNAEANGIRDRDGERFLIPVIVTSGN